jgi:hypothetical protein
MRYAAKALIADGLKRLRLGGDDEGPVDFDGYAALKQIDREYQEAFGWLSAHQYAFGASQQAVCDTDPLALAKVWMGQDGETGLVKLLNGFDLCVGDNLQEIPSLTEQFHKTPCLAYVQIAVFIHRVAKEKVTRKHGNRDPVSRPVASGPGVHAWEKKVESLVCQLIMDKLLGVAAGPENVPPRLARFAELTADR